MRRIVLTFLLGFTFLAARSQQGGELKVMTFNIRFDNPTDSIYSWDNRKRMVFQLLDQRKPAIIGLQEALKKQIEEIQLALPSYKHVGVGREDGVDGGEFSPIFYDSTRFTQLNQGTFWLSETPQVPGSKSWGTACTRIVTWVILKEVKSGKIIYCYNTHFDHISDKARLESAKMIQKHMKNFAGGEEVLVTGDFNSNQQGSAYKQLVDRTSIYPLNDTRKLAGIHATGPSYSFVGFPFKPSSEGIIDYIFIKVNSTFKVKSNEIIDFHVGDKYPSDHLPVMTIFSY